MKPWLWFLLAVVASTATWSYRQRVLLPWEDYLNVRRTLLKHHMGDLYPRWVGARELLLNGRNPYGIEVSHQIQVAFYGHPIDQSYDRPKSEIIDEERFAYPLYVVLLLAPTIRADFASVQAGAAVFLAALTAMSVWLWLGVLRWRPPALTIAALILFVLASPQVAQGLGLRQLALLVTFLLALAGWCVARNRYFLAGIVLALSTIKPQMIALCLVWFLLWMTGDWRKRWPLAAGFSIAMGVLIGLGELLLPGWIGYFIEGMEAYRKYFPTTSLLRLMLGDWVGGTLSALLVAALLVYSWRKRRDEADSPEFVYVLCLFFIATTIALPLLNPFNQPLLLLPVMLLVRDWNRLPRLGRIAFFAFVAWPWIAYLLLLLHPPRVDSLSRLTLLPSSLVLLFPFLVSWLIFVRRKQTV